MGQMKEIKPPNEVSLDVTAMVAAEDGTLFKTAQSGKTDNHGMHVTFKVCAQLSFCILLCGRRTHMGPSYVHGYGMRDGIQDVIWL